jgi:hypothetical protein
MPLLAHITDAEGTLFRRTIQHTPTIVGIHAESSNSGETNKSFDNSYQLRVGSTRQLFPVIGFGV